MPAGYCWDLGFNWNAAVNPGSNSFYLQNGVVGYSGTTSAFPTTAVNWQIGDTVNFNVYNTTTGSITPSDFSVVNASLTLSPSVVDQELTTPFALGKITSQPGSMTWEDWYSMIFENTLPVWTGIPQQ